MSGRFGKDTGEFKLDSALGRLSDLGFGENWSVSEFRRTLIKFGRSTNLAADVRSTLWEVGPVHETYLMPADGNLITVISSTDALDVGHIIRVEGLYYDADGRLVFLVQNVVSNGQNRVTLPTPLSRCTRLRDIDLFPLVGDLYAYQGAGTTDTAGLPDDLDFTHNVLKGTLGLRQSFKGSATIGDKIALLVTDITFSISRRQATLIDFAFEVANFTVTGPNLPFGFLPAYGAITLNSAGKTAINLALDPVIIIPPNHEVRAVATSSASGAQGNITFSGYFAGQP